ncbi:MAG: hypothetical protein RLN70_10385, partial [Rhodospirillaceae bacterium]
SHPLVVPGSTQVGGDDYTANILNQYPTIGTNTLTYDGNGNLTGAGDWTYTYDEDNRLTDADFDDGNQTLTADYTYDAAASGFLEGNGFSDVVSLARQ